MYVKEHNKSKEIQILKSQVIVAYYEKTKNMNNWSRGKKRSLGQRHTTLLSKSFNEISPTKRRPTKL